MITTYIDGISSDFSALEWWKLSSLAFTFLVECQESLAIQLSSAAAKRVFSLLNAGFGDIQETPLDITSKHLSC